MPVFKITYIYALQANGWSETWYTTANDRSAAQNRATNVFRTANLLRGLGVIPEAYRIGDEAIDHDAQIFGSGFSKATGVAAADDVWTAGFTNVYAGFHRRTFLVRGVPDSAVLRNLDADEQGVKNVMQMSGTWKQAWANFVSSLIENQFALKVLDRNEGTNPRHRITAVLQEGITNFYQFVIPGLLMDPGDEFHVYGIPSSQFPGASGKHRVRTVDGGDTYTTFTPFPLGNTNLYFGGGEARKRVLLYPQIDRADLRGVRKRDTGRRFFVTRGRR